MRVYKQAATCKMIGCSASKKTDQPTYALWFRERITPVQCLLRVGETFLDGVISSTMYVLYTLCMHVLYVCMYVLHK